MTGDGDNQTPNQPGSEGQPDEEQRKQEPPVWQPQPLFSPQPQQGQPAEPSQPAQPAQDRPTWPPVPSSSPYGSGSPYGAAPTGLISQPGGLPATPPIPPAGLPYTPPPGYGYSSSWQVPATSAPRPTKLPQLLTFVAIALIAFSAGMFTNDLVFGGSNTSNNKTTATGNSTGVPLTGFDLYNQALDVIRRNYVGKSGLTDKQLVYGSIRGLVNSLGDTGHTTFMTPEEYQAATGDLNGSFGGIGVVGTDVNGVPTIERVLPGTPAEKAGIKAGDQIIEVDGISTSGKSFSDIVSNIRGTVGTQVKLTVVHLDSTTPVTIAVTRAQIEAPLVEWGMVPGTHVADIVLFEFSQGASAQLATAITAATTAGATGIVFDLRGNPGGYVSEAQGVAGEFMKSGTLYIQQDADGNRTPVSIDTSKKETNLPMVVLVDHNSASAAEIVTGALQDSHRAKVVGITTVGTGTVLQIFPLSDGSAIALATAEYLTPNGTRIFGTGIKPDEMVALPVGTQPIDPATLPTMTAAQFKASTDAELKAAVTDLGQ